VAILAAATVAYSPLQKQQPSAALPLKSLKYLFVTSTQPRVDNIKPLISYWFKLKRTSLLRRLHQLSWHLDTLDQYHSCKCFHNTPPISRCEWHLICFDPKFNVPGVSEKIFFMMDHRAKAGKGTVSRPTNISTLAKSLGHTETTPPSLILPSLSSLLKYWVG